MITACQNCNYKNEKGSIEETSYSWWSAWPSVSIIILILLHANSSIFKTCERIYRIISGPPPPPPPLPFEYLLKDSHYVERPCLCCDINVGRHPPTTWIPCTPLATPDSTEQSGRRWLLVRQSAHIFHRRVECHPFPASISRILPSISRIFHRRATIGPTV